MRKIGYPQIILNKALLNARSCFFKPKPKSSFSHKNKIIVPFSPLLNSRFNNQFLRSFNSGLIFKYPNTIRSNFSNSNSVSNSKAGIYKINCLDCPCSYIGETGRDLPTRIKEHKNNIRDLKNDNGIASHFHSSNHRIDFVNANLIYKSNDCKTRKIIESAFISLNNSSSLNQNAGFFPLGFNISRFFIKSIT